MLVVSFYKTGELDFTEKHQNWFRMFMFIIFFAVVLIFLHAIRIDTADGTFSILEIIFDYILNNATGAVVMSILVLAIAIAAILYIVKDPKKAGDS